MGAGYLRRAGRQGPARGVPGRTGEEPGERTLEGHPFPRLDGTGLTGWRSGWTCGWSEWPTCVHGPEKRGVCTREWEAGAERASDGRPARETSGRPCTSPREACLKLRPRYPEDS